MSSPGYGDTGDPFLEEHITSLLDNEPEEPEQEYRIQTTFDKERINEPYGDSHQQKDPDHDRWYIQNVNGINPEYNWMEWRTQMRVLQEMQVDGFSFTETNLRWTPEQTKAARTIGRYWFKQIRLQTSASNDPTTRKSYQPGGTCTGITNKLAGRITQQGKDPSGLGRWSYFSLEGKPINTDGDGKNYIGRLTLYLHI